MDFNFGFLILTLQTAACLAGEYCYINSELHYCEYDCCGSWYDRSCCANYSWIIGVAVGGFFLVVGGIGLLLFCLVYKKKHQRSIVAPRTTTTTFTTYPGQVYGNQPQPYQTGVQPPPYGMQQGTYPPPFPPPNQPQSHDPAYPPQPAVYY